MEPRAEIEEIQGVPCAVLRNLIGTRDDLEVLADVLGREGFRPDLRWLIDNRSSDDAPTTQDVERLVEFLTRHAGEVGDIRAALLVATDVGYGMGRVLEALSLGSPLCVRTFRSREEAEGWLLGPDPTPACASGVLPQRPGRL